MAYLRIDYNSNALRRTTTFDMLIPNDPPADAPKSEWEKPLYTLFLLHGYHAKAYNWVPDGLAQYADFVIGLVGNKITLRDRRDF